MPAGLQAVNNGPPSVGGISGSSPQAPAGRKLVWSWEPRPSSPRACSPVPGGSMRRPPLGSSHKVCCAPCPLEGPTPPSPYTTWLISERCSRKRTGAGWGGARRGNSSGSRDGNWPQERLWPCHSPLGTEGLFNHVCFMEELPHWVRPLAGSCPQPSALGAKCFSDTLDQAGQTCPLLPSFLGFR